MKMHETALLTVAQEVAKLFLPSLPSTILQAKAKK
jgi:hypothetical protein